LKPDASALVKDGSGAWLQFTRPIRKHVAVRMDEVRPVIERVESAALAGHYCAGYISYEASAAFDRALVTKRPSGPLVWFREYASCRRLKRLPEATGKYSLVFRRPGVSRAAYKAGIDEIKSLLKAGSTYQVNYTFPLFYDFDGDPYSLFRQLQLSQRSNYSVFIDCGDRTICSVSPELFYQKQGRRIESRPMKGTARRLPDTDNDRIAEQNLADSAKNAAENVMIVDMIRNDLGRISDPGTVTVASLFQIERYPTVFQATSTVVGRTSETLWGVLKALFPCASVTGAPKVETMKIIKRLEKHTRGIYTGAIGYVSSSKTLFNVGIRSLSIGQDGAAVYGVGSGIVWESDAESEYDECMAKADVLVAGRSEFRLFETMLWQPGRGYALSREHVDRIVKSARYFGFQCTKRALKSGMKSYAGRLNQRSIVRMLLSESGKVSFEAKALKEQGQPWRVAIAATKVDSRNVFLYHKTTNRSFYDAALKERPDCHDMLLFNERGELAESCKANVVVVIRGKHYTPPVCSGLLAGTYRSRLLKRGVLRERKITRRDLGTAESIYLINSVRGRISIILEEDR